MTAPSVAADGRDAWVARFDAAEDRRRREPAWLAERRREAIARVVERGFPTVRDEAWRFTNPAPIVRTRFRAPEPAPVDFDHPSLVEALGLVPSPAARVVLVDGVYEPALSHGVTVPGTAAPARYAVSSLAQAIERSPDVLATLLGRHATPDSSVFTALNQALFDDGVFVWLACEVSVGAPIQIASVATAGATPAASHPRVVVFAEAGSRASIVEAHVTLGAFPATAGRGASGSGPASPSVFSNAVTEVVLGANAHVDHVRVLRGEQGSLHVGTVRAHVGRDATFGSLSVAFGGLLSRVEIDVRFAGEGGSCALDGLYVVGGREHVDHHTRIDHAVPRCTSRELYKGILDGESSAVFAGRVTVREDAQKTDARQANHTLLLSERATIDTKPELEIFADDVKCAHGATVGRLDDEAVFYLRTRGIERSSAQAMLIHAFASEVLRRGSPAVPAERLEEMLAGRLPGTEATEGRAGPEGSAPKDVRR